MFYDDALKAAGVSGVPALVGKCPTTDACHYGENNMYQPPATSYSWHPPPYTAFKDKEWVEVSHQQDPFGDEHVGMWLLYAKGAGIWYNIGRSINFPEHVDAFQHWGLRLSNAENEHMCQLASNEGYQTIQFTAHRDTTNYPCENTIGTYMNIEIVAVELQGTYSCGTKGQGSFKSGWHSKSCNCDDKIKVLNCGADGAPGKLINNFEAALQERSERILSQLRRSQGAVLNKSVPSLEGMHRREVIV
jgi:hypothetical protein